MKLKNNYHTHCVLCKHAVGELEDYVKKAIELGMEEIGFTDHVPFNDEVQTRTGTCRMSMNDFYEKYLPELARLKQKYQDQIKIYAGVEAEYFWKQKEDIPKLAKLLDYMILGEHYVSKGEYITCQAFKNDSYDDDIDIYLDNVTEAIETGYFTFLAHPDIYLLENPRMTPHDYEIAKKIIELCVKHDIPLELNANGISRNKRTNSFYFDEELQRIVYGYPNYRFFKFLKDNYPEAKVIVNADAHNPNNLDCEATEEALAMAKELNLNIIEKLNINK